MNLITQNIQMTSLDLAELTSKNHSHIMRDIRDEIDQLGEIGQSIFGLGSYSDKNKQDRPMFTFSKKGAMQIAMRYSAEIRFKVIEYVEQLENQNKPHLPTTYKEALQHLIVVVEEKELLENKIKEEKPLVEFAKTVEGTAEKISIGDLAKLTDGKIGRNKLFKLLRDNGILMKKNIPYQQYVDRGYFEVSERIIKAATKDIVSLTTYCTGKGQVWIIGKLEEWLNG